MTSTTRADRESAVITPPAPAGTTAGRCDHVTRRRPFRLVPELRPRWRCCGRASPRPFPQDPEPGTFLGALHRFEPRRCQIFCVSSGYLFERRHCCDHGMRDAERAERRARQRELADRLKASGALDGIFEQIDAGEVPLGGDDGLLKGMLKAALERGLEVELS